MSDISVIEAINNALVAAMKGLDAVQETLKLILVELQKRPK